MIRAMTQDPEHHLEEMNMKLQYLAPLNGEPPVLTAEDRHWFERERKRTDQCLNICDQGLALLDELRLQNDGPAEHVTLAEIMTLLALRRCRDDLALHLRSKEEHAGSYLPRRALHQEAADPASSHDEPRLATNPQSTEHCLAVLPPADEGPSSSGVNVVEDVDIGIDGRQMLITSGDQLFEARHVKLGNRARQIVMSSSEEALKEFLRSNN